MLNSHGLLFLSFQFCFELSAKPAPMMLRSD